MGVFVPRSHPALTVARKKIAELRKAAASGNQAPSPDLANTPALEVSSDGVTTPSGTIDTPGNAAAVKNLFSWPSHAIPLAMRIASVAVVVHVVVITIAYLAVVRASGIQGRIVDGFAPYLATFHLAPEGNSADAVAAEGVAFHLARGDGAERVYRLQVASGQKPDDDSQWRQATWVAEGGSERARRYQRFLAAVADLGVNDQNALAGRLILPALRSDTDADWVRIIRLPNLMTNVVQDAEPAPYTAAILRGDGGTRLVRVPEPRLTSAATP